MDWTDEGIVLGLRHHGENSAILDTLTRERGRHMGLVRGATSKRMKGALEPGNTLNLHWRGRLDEHLGNYAVELARARAALVFDDGLKLAILSAACAVVSAALPERERHTRVFEGLTLLLDDLPGENAGHGLMNYVHFELLLLEDVGFGLDLASCAATGLTDDLTHVSPKTGRAVSSGAAAPYKNRLLKLPPFLSGAETAPTLQDLSDGLALSGHFLERSVLAPHGAAMPPARLRLAERLAAANPAR